MKKSKVTVVTKRPHSENPEDMVTIRLEYEGTTYTVSAYKDQEFTALICQFFKVNLQQALLMNRNILLFLSRQK